MVSVMAPVNRQLKKQTDSVLTVCHNPGTHRPVREKMHQALLCSFGAVDYRNNPMCRRTLAACHGVEPIMYMGKQIRFEQLLENSLSAWFGLYDYTAMLTESIIRSVEPKGILVGNDLTVAGRITCRIARRHSIATFSICHGTIDNTLWKLGSSSRFYLWGEEDRQRLVGWGVDPDRLVVAGSPKHEEAVKNVRTVHQRAGAWKRRFLIATSGPGHKITKVHHIRIVDSLTNLAKQLEDVLFVAKLHRKDSPSYYREFVNLPNSQLVEYDPSERSGNIVDWLNASDLLITGGSTTAIDAMYMGVPVVTIDLDGELGDVSFIQQGATMHATNMEQLHHHVGLIEDEKWQVSPQQKRQSDYVSSRFAKPERGPAAFIADHILAELS